MPTIIHDSRARIRGELVRRLRALEPLIAREQHLLRHLLEDYNGVLEQARQLQDAILDDLEDAQDRGEGAGPIDYCHYFWCRADFVPLVVPDRPTLQDADRLEGLPGDV